MREEEEEEGKKEKEEKANLEGRSEALASMSQSVRTHRTLNVDGGGSIGIDIGSHEILLHT